MASGPRIAVVGLGSIGAMTSWQLARRGATVTGFEQYSPGHDRGAHGGETRIFRTAYLESPDYVPLLQRARALWRELEAETGADLLHLGGVLTIGSGATAEMGNIRTSVESYGLDVEELTPAAARSRYPQHTFEDDDAVVLDRDAGLLRPELAVLHAGLRAETLGATVHRYTRVTAVEPDDRGVVVRSDAGEERFDHAVVSTGPWAMELLERLGYAAGTIHVRRPVQAWFPARDPSLFRADRCPVFIRLTPLHCYGLPATDGSGLKLGLSYEDNLPVDDPRALDRTVTVAELEKFRDTARRLLPQVYPDPTRVSAYMEGYTADHHALVGRLPGSDRVTVLAGFSGHGFKLAPAFGELGADTALGAAGTPPIPQLDPARPLGPPPGDFTVL
ncbi:MAG: N-methyl-L-tryptophan oxidase [Streptosporangiales bacterium]|nr:N-methyl-L-tryptophan oxidase [Streptosporangiales bacterium]